MFVYSEMRIVKLYKFIFIVIDVMRVKLYKYKQN